MRLLYTAANLITVGFNEPKKFPSFDKVMGRKNKNKTILEPDLIKAYGIEDKIKKNYIFKPKDKK